MNATGKKVPKSFLWGLFAFGVVYVVLGFGIGVQGRWSGIVVTGIGCLAIFACGASVGSNFAMRRVMTAADLGLDGMEG